VFNRTLAHSVPSYTQPVLSNRNDTVWLGYQERVERIWTLVCTCK